MTLAWHFANTQMRDGTPLGAPGDVETHDGPLVMCSQGLHASELLLDALKYAPGALLRRVRLRGHIQHDDDKMVADCREVLWECDMTAALRLFARKCALDVANMWPIPPLVREYLMTGREDLRAAAWAAARDAAREAARGAAWEAARGAAREAAWDAAWEAAREAAWGAAWEAAWAAARGAARDSQERRLVAYAQAARAGLFHA